MTYRLERDRVESLVAEACVELWAGNAQRALPDPDSAEVALPNAFVATVGFTSAACCGALLIATGGDLLASSHPLADAGSTLSTRDLIDWGAELANQLLGRLKNKLAARGLAIELSTPVVMRCPDLHLHLQVCCGTVWSYRVDHARFALGFDLELLPGFQLGDVDERHQVVWESEMIEF